MATQAPIAGILFCAASIDREPARRLICLYIANRREVKYHKINHHAKAGKDYQSQDANT
jgi:hypothetical protein